ncbi:Gp49 family protein [Pasteurella multocida]|uniref:Gp49 family protein n=1 Tax=Pasteurella multocida TaxID=747 RepID=UPI001CB94200|nr:Gp49 family protein [Pasteurella multocida]
MANRKRTKLILGKKMENRVTKEHLESIIVDKKFHRLTETLTVCVLTLRNGFTVTGESACVDPASYNQEIGENIAYENAFEKLWQLEGYMLKTKLYDEKSAHYPEDIKNQTPFNFGYALNLLKKGKKVSRAGWNGKGMFLFIVKGGAITQAVAEHYGNSERPETNLPVLDAIYMKTADNKLVPWLAIQTDVLAEDWNVID